MTLSFIFFFVSGGFDNRKYHNARYHNLKNFKNGKKKMLLQDPSKNSYLNQINRSKNIDF